MLSRRQNTSRSRRLPCAAATTISDGAEVRPASGIIRSIPTGGTVKEGKGEEELRAAVSLRRGEVLSTSLEILLAPVVPGVLDGFESG